MSLLMVENLSKRYDAPAVSDASFALGRGRILCLLGPSGCGKTTLLRMIAGLTPPDSGRVVFDGVDMTRVAPHKRNFGLMFQEFALFPHKSVFENVTFGPEMQNLGSVLVRDRADEMLSLVGMTELAGRNVAELSGGERQRVALARSLASRPGLLMLDEPLGSLDRNLREKLLPEIRTVLKKLDVPAIFVTHDQAEALAAADEIAVMNRGRIEQIDSPEDLYMGPKSEFAARFLGFRNLLRGKTRSDGAVVTGAGIFYPERPCGRDNADVVLALRPEGASLVEAGEENGGLQTIRGIVKDRVFAGQTYRVQILEGGGTTLFFDLPNSKPPPPVGKTTTLKIDPYCMVEIAPSEDKTR